MRAPSSVMALSGLPASWYSHFCLCARACCGDARAAARAVLGGDGRARSLRLWFNASRRRHATRHALLFLDYEHLPLSGGDFWECVTGGLDGGAGPQCARVNHTYQQGGNTARAGPLRSSSSLWVLLTGSRQHRRRLPQASLSALLRRRKKIAAANAKAWVRSPPAWLGAARPRKNSAQLPHFVQAVRHRVYSRWGRR